MVDSAGAANNAAVWPQVSYPERTIRPGNLAEAEAIAPGLTPVYGDFSDFVVDVETPAGDRLAIDDPRLISLIREGIRDRHELTMLRSDRSMTDCRPVSIFSLQTAHQLTEELRIEVDKRRFRANLYVDLESGRGFGEDEFVGGTLSIGAKTVIAVVKRDSRCKISTLDPDTAQQNPAVLRHLAQQHEGQAGIYGAVLSEGTMRPGDKVSLLD